MIVEYTPEGLVTHVVRDPVPEGLIEVLDANNVTYVSFPPVAQTEIDEEGVEHTVGIIHAELDLQTDYIKLPEKIIAKRPTFSFPTEITLSVGQSYTLSGIPVGTIIWCDGTSTPVTEDSIQLDGDMPAEYTLVLMNGVYIPLYIKVKVNEV